ncbi:MAG: valine--tRNA ligase [Anaerolineales bacterium]|nr:valine--tRNA ligase [Anaerolineales bacterium]
MKPYELAKTYDFSAVEKRLYDWWEQEGFFSPSGRDGEGKFVISMPPPNVTGKLHLGHAMFVAMEDLMVRYHRMKGFDTLWVPGTDHAGIATQQRVEADLLSKGTSREEVGREEFIRLTWEWKHTYGGFITQQLRRLGASCDWSRERFTLDDGLSCAVREAFVSLYEKELIYRGTYLINWSPGLQTAVSDLEVEYSEEQGKLYYFRYTLAESDEYLPVATTRPETILGDTAVAVHPDDERYKHLIGKTCLVPILARPIPIIADAYVDREFGTGALKITPGHDPNDYEIGARHKLEVINILHPDATLNENAGPYAGQDRYECRKNLWRDMEAAGLTIREEDYTMQVPRSQRGGEIIEPMVSTQWFVKMEPLAAPALERVRSGAITIVPERFNKVYYNWLENIRDWCISRQLWWGHRIPAWHCQDCGGITVLREDPTTCQHCGSTRLEQDPDVLDTWFSSSLWPFSTLGWPDQTEDLTAYYPTTMMETGYDILFFWVARMIMMGLEFTGTVPFSTVYLHGLIRDGNGRKMSKSLGNVIDPLEVMDELGTDALRFTLLTASTPGQDMNLSLQRVEGNRNFANKLWNAGRLVLMALEKAPAAALEKPEPTAADRWVLARLRMLVQDVDRLMEACQYGEAGRQIYDYFWNEFADWYLEISKLQTDHGGDRAWLTAKTLVHILDTCLRLLHPFTPFVTEELWGKLKAACLYHPAGFAPVGSWETALMLAKWPAREDLHDEDRQLVDQFAQLMDVIRGIRNIRAEKQIEPSRSIPALIHAGDMADFLTGERETLIRLARLDAERLTIRSDEGDVPADSIPLVIGRIEIFLPVSGMLDVEEEWKRLEGELQEADEQIDRIAALLASPFAERAPDHVVQKERERLEEYRQAKAMLDTQLETLKKM